MAFSSHRTVIRALLLGLAFVALSAVAAYAQDDGTGEVPYPEDLQEWEVSPAEEGYTVWHKEIKSGCLFTDHNYTLDIPEDPAQLTDISYTMSNWDVDYNTQGCPGGPEVDLMYFNRNLLGRLTGANNSWSVNSWPLTRAQLVKGRNAIYIDTDSTRTDCWCVGVGWIEVRAKVGFQVKQHSPQSDDKNRDFHKDAVDLTVSFSEQYDPTTINGNTFRLEYRNAAGVWQRVAGSFSHLAPNKFRYTPAADLKPAIRYRATVAGGSGGVKSKEGKELAGDVEWYFWTVPDLSLTNQFDYGSGSLCPPSNAPCPGLELAVFQVARNASMVPNKPAVARLYARWPKAQDVYAFDQVMELKVNVTLKAGDSAWSASATVRRPDQYATFEREAAQNSVQVYHTPNSNFDYTAEVIPQPQSNSVPVKYNAAQKLTNSRLNEKINFDYYVLKDGDWLNGAPDAAKAEGVNLLTEGSQLVTDEWPVHETTFNQKGDLTIGYTFTGNTIEDATCGTQQEVSCPVFWFIKLNMSEMECVYRKLDSLRGGVLGIGADKFVAATVPKTLCPKAASFAMAEKVFMHQYDAGNNGAAIAHEIGHIYGLSPANSPNSGHRDDSTGVEGFQVRTQTNRSRTENPDQAISLMHRVVQAKGASWIHNDDYAYLFKTVTAAEQAEASAASQYIIISGEINATSGEAQVGPGLVQEAPKDAETPTGRCTVDLLDATDTRIGTRRVNPGTTIQIIQTDGTPGQAAATAGDWRHFAVSVPWNPAAERIRLTCDGTIRATVERTRQSPMVNFTGLSDGQTLTGVVVLNWQGSDSDSPNLTYQLQFSTDSGLTWTPLTPLDSATSMTLDTAGLPSGDNRGLRVMATDGFNTSYATRRVRVKNSLRLNGSEPTRDDRKVSITAPVTLLFATDVYSPSLQSGGLQVLRDGTKQVDGKITASGRLVTFTPSTPLDPGANYTVRLARTVADTAGNTLGSIKTWTFLTEPDTIPPSVMTVSPMPAAVGVPQNAVIQAQFSEPVMAGSVTPDTFQLLDAGNNLVPGSVRYDPATRRAWFTPASQLQPNSDYTARLNAGITDAAANAMERPYVWRFSTSLKVAPTIRILGNYQDEAKDSNGDGLYDQLVISVDVEAQSAGGYNLNARLLDKNGALLQWASTGNVSLARGVQTLRLTYSSVPIRSNGVDGPYVLDSLSIYSTANTGLFDARYNAYQTYAYDADAFYSILTLNALPNQLVEWNTTRQDVFNLRSYTAHMTQPVTSVAYSIISNTDSRVGVSIDENANVDINPKANIEAESDVTIRARDGQGNWVTSTFHVSVQKPRPDEIRVAGIRRARLNDSFAITATVLDQWDRLIGEPAVVNFQTTLGSVSPASVTTTNGKAVTMFNSGPIPGTAFITIEAGSAVRMVEVPVNNTRLWLPRLSK